MPFEPNFPRALTASTVRAYAPAQAGVIGLSNASSWIYIGEADNMQAALLEYCHGGNSPLTPGDSVPTGFIFEMCDRARLPSRLAELTREFGTPRKTPASSHTLQPRSSLAMRRGKEN
jgi:hypothetical protein